VAQTKVATKTAGEPVEASGSEGAAAPDASVAARPEAPSGRGPSGWVFFLGGVGFAGLAAAGVFQFVDHQSAVASGCAPRCGSGVPAAFGMSTRDLEVASVVSAGVGGAAIGIATLMLALSRPAAEKSIIPAKLVLDVRPAPAGAIGSIAGHF
jgi:hypothetical protein